MTVPLRLRAALLVSVLVHVLALVALTLRPPRVTIRHGVELIPIGLVGGGGGGGRTTAEHAATPSETTATAPPVAPVVPPRVVAREPRRTAARPSAMSHPTDSAKAETSPAGSGSGAGSGGGEGGGAGTGQGTGVGAGSAPVGVAYDANPRPPYPVVARRLGLEGTVELSALVAPDGRPSEVHVVRSSGHEVLDASALATVREKWRFVAARRDGVPIEDRVTFPIRFSLY